MSVIQFKAFPSAYWSPVVWPHRLPLPGLCLHAILHFPAAVSQCQHILQLSRLANENKQPNHLSEQTPCARTRGPKMQRDTETHVAGFKKKEKTWSEFTKAYRRDCQQLASRMVVPSWSEAKECTLAGWDVHAERRVTCLAHVEGGGDPRKNVLNSA